MSLHPSPKTSSPDKTYVGGEALAKLLDLNVTKEAKKAFSDYQTATSKDAKLKALDRLRYLHGLQNMGFKSPTDAYMLHHVPILPPEDRPILVKGNGNLEYADINHLYRDHMLVNENLKDLKETLPPDMLLKERADLYKGLKSVVGLGHPISIPSAQKGLKGLLEQVSGTSGPKGGYFHKKILSKKQDFSGRLTLIEDASLGLNEAKIPEDMAWTMYKLHGVKKLISQGYSYAEAVENWDKRSPAARVALDQVTSEVPVIANRAPSLLKSNLMAFYAKPSNVNGLMINPLNFKGFSADVDGDSLSLFLPMHPKAIQEAKEKLLPMHNITDSRKGVGNIMFAPSHEAVLGANYLTEPDMKKKVLKFRTEEDALKALHSGQIEANQPIEIGD